MIAGFVIALREGLEATLIVGIVLAFLARTGRRSQFRQVYVGMILAILTSIGFAIGFQWLAGGFSGVIAEIFEGITTLIAAALLISMIVWMNRRGPTLQKELESQTAQAISSKPYGLVSLVFIAILREGVETVIFLTVLPTSDLLTLIGAIIGFATAITLAFIYFVSTKRFRLQTFFNVTNILLVLFAAGMIAYGIHELQEATIIPIFIEHVWDINFILDENSPLGLVLKGLIGYNANPSLIEVISYLVVFLTMTILLVHQWYRQAKHPKQSKAIPESADTPDSSQSLLTQDTHDNT